MYFTRILLSIVFVLFASTTLAAKKEKDLICHVGNEEGPAGETYLDDPGCTLTEENGYFCPDAGKIDLILVPANAKHIGNPAHEYGGLPDYAPFKDGAGSDPADFEDNNGDGIDEGCEPDEVILTCPCWDGSHKDASWDGTLADFVAELDGWWQEDNEPVASCGSFSPTYYGIQWGGSRVFTRDYDKGKRCGVARDYFGGPDWEIILSAEQLITCQAELDEAMAVAKFCNVQ